LSVHRISGFNSKGNAVSTLSSDLRTLSHEAFIYFYPLVIIDVSRKRFTNVEPGKMFARGPMKTFSHPHRP